MFRIVPDLIDDDGSHLKEFLECIGMFVTPNNTSPLINILSSNKGVQSIQIIVSPFEIRRLIDIDSRTWELRLKEFKCYIVIDFPFLLLLLFAVLFRVDESLLVAILFLFVAKLFILLKFNNLLVKVVFLHKLVNVIRGEIVSE